MNLFTQRIFQTIVDELLRTSIPKQRLKRIVQLFSDIRHEPRNLRRPEFLRALKSTVGIYAGEVYQIIHCAVLDGRDAKMFADAVQRLHCADVPIPSARV